MCPAVAVMPQRKRPSQFLRNANRRTDELENDVIPGRFIETAERNKCVRVAKLMVQPR